MGSSFLIGIHSMQGWADLQDMELQEKEKKTGSRVYKEANAKKPTDKECVLTLDLKLLSS